MGVRDFGELLGGERDETTGCTRRAAGDLAGHRGCETDQEEDEMNHKLLNKTLKATNRELRAEVKRLTIELECIKLVKGK